MSTEGYEIQTDRTGMTRAQLQRRFPRRLCRAGYIMGLDATNKLGQSLRPDRWRTLPHLDCPGIGESLHKHFAHLENKEKDEIVESSLTGDDRHFFDFIVSTQGCWLKEGYLGMPESEMPTFVEGPFEERVRAFLAEHGMC